MGGQWFSNHLASESSAELVNTNFQVPPTFRISDVLGLGWLLEMHILNKILGDAAAVDWGPHLGSDGLES